MGAVGYGKVRGNLRHSRSHIRQGVVREGLVQHAGEGDNDRPVLPCITWE